MNDSNKQINEQFAKQLLKALYKLDIPLGDLDNLILRTDDPATKEALFRIMSQIMETMLNELMVPIYRCHPSLGCASEPGAWLKEV